MHLANYSTAQLVEGKDDWAGFEMGQKESKAFFFFLSNYSSFFFCVLEHSSLFPQTQSRIEHMGTFVFHSVIMRN